MPRGTLDTGLSLHLFAYGTFTLYGLSFPAAHSAKCSRIIMPVHNPELYCYTLVWALPRSLATTYGISVDFFSCGYLDVSVPHVSLRIHYVFMYTIPEHLPQVGFPIRKSTGQWLFAPPRSLSQLITSFIGSWCQGIHPMLLLA